jgi:hypothetical protein
LNRRFFLNEKNFRRKTDENFAALSVGACPTEMWEMNYVLKARIETPKFKQKGAPLYSELYLFVERKLQL